MGDVGNKGSRAGRGRSGTIYADYQATTPVDPRVLDAMMPYWQEAFGNPHSSDHIVGWSAAEAVNSSLSAVAALIGADADEIIFTSGATEANNLALLGLGRRAPADRRRVLVSAIEHKCVLSAARALAEREGIQVDTIPVDRQGFVEFGALEELVDDNVLLVSVMAVNNEIGTIQDLPRIATTLKSHGVIFHCDAAQAPSAMSVADLTAHADVISLSGHKMYGPQGVGTLFIRRALQDKVEPLIYGGGQQGGLRSGTVPVALCVGMAAAAQIQQSEAAPAERERVARLRDQFIEGLQSGPWPVTVNGPSGTARHPGNVNIRFEGLVAQDVLAALQPDLAASTGAACASGIPEPSHVLRAIGLNDTEADESIRFSFGRFTESEEVTAAAVAVKSVLQIEDI